MAATFVKVNPQCQVNMTPKLPPSGAKKISPLRPTLAIVLGSGFHHALTELRVDKMRRDLA